MVGSHTNFYMPRSGKSLKLVSSDSSEEDKDSESCDEESKTKKELEVLYDAWITIENT